MRPLYCSNLLYLTHTHTHTSQYVLLYPHHTVCLCLHVALCLPIHFTLNGARTPALLELWMLDFHIVNELQRKELAEKLVKPFAHHRKLCRRPRLRFYHRHACRSGLSFGDLHTVSVIHTQSHTRTQMCMCTYRHSRSAHMFIHMHAHVHAVYTAGDKRICFQLQTCRQFSQSDTVMLSHTFGLNRREAEASFHCWIGTDPHAFSSFPTNNTPVV